MTDLAAKLHECRELIGWSAVALGLLAFLIYLLTRKRNTLHRRIRELKRL